MNCSLKKILFREIQNLQFNLKLTFEEFLKGEQEKLFCPIKNFEKNVSGKLVEKNLRKIPVCINKKSDS